MGDSMVEEKRKKISYCSGMGVQKSAQSLMLELMRKKWAVLGDGGVGLGNEYYVHGGGDESGRV